MKGLDWYWIDRVSVEQGYAKWHQVEFMNDGELAMYLFFLGGTNLI